MHSDCHSFNGCEKCDKEIKCLEIGWIKLKHNENG